MTKIAIIPARGGSKRLPRKNIVELGGRPMVTWPIKTARDSGLFDRIIVSTDDDEIAEIAGDAGAEVAHRDPELADDRATVAQVCADLLRKLATQDSLPKEFCCIYATAAFLLPLDLQESASHLDLRPEIKVVMGVTEYLIHPYKALAENAQGCLVPIWPDLNARKSQAFPPAYASNGTFYWARAEFFLEEPTFYPKGLLGHLVPVDRAVDIDTSDDLERAQRVMAARKYFDVESGLS